MGTLYLVRHGQASLGAQNYDQLSELGHQQSLRLGAYWRRKGLAFDTVFTGTLRRHAQTWAAIAEAADYTNEVIPWAGLNEYDSEAVISAVHPHPRDKPDTPERYREHFRLLRVGLTRWMRGELCPDGMPSYPDFLAGITSALDHIRHHCDGRVLIVSSGGPIATAIGHVLGTGPEATVELNMRIRNSAVTEFTFTPKRHTLLSYNTLPHLEEPAHASWVTYA